MPLPRTVQPHNPLVRWDHPLSRDLYYVFPMNEGGGGLYDHVNHKSWSLTGTLSWQSPTRCAYGRYLYFNPGRAILNDWDNSAGLTTLACLFRPTTASGYRILLAVDDVSTRIFQFRVSQSPVNTIEWIGWHTDGFSQWQSTETVTQDAWHFAVITVDGTNVTLYLNGVQIKQVAKGPLSSGTEQLHIGSRDGGADPFRGDMAFVGVWRRALASWEVRELSRDPWTLTRPVRLSGPADEALDLVEIVNESGNVTETVNHRKLIVQIRNESGNVTETVNYRKLIVEIVNESGNVTETVNHRKLIVQIRNESGNVTETALDFVGVLILQIVDESLNVSESQLPELTVVQIPPVDYYLELEGDVLPKSVRLLLYPTAFTETYHFPWRVTKSPEPD